MANDSMQKASRAFWSKTEGTTGMIFMGAIALILVVTATTWVPIVFTLAQTGLYAALMIVGIAIIGMALSDATIRSRFRNIFQFGMRWLTHKLISIDPGTQMRGYISKLKEKLRFIADQISVVKGHLAIVSRGIDEGKTNAEKYFEQANYLRKNGNPEVEVAAAAGKGSREMELVKTLTEQHKYYSRFYDRLLHLQKNCKFTVDEVEHRVSVMEREDKITKAGANVVRSMKEILFGGADGELFDEAQQIMADNIGLRLGELDSFMDMSKDILDTVDTERGMMNDKGLQMLDLWEQRGSDLFSSESLMSLSVDKPVKAITAEIVTPLQVNAPRQVSHSKFLDS